MRVRNSKVAFNTGRTIRRPRMTTWIVILLMPGLMFGCYGQFPLTKTVYRMNGDVSDNGVAQSLVLWIFAFFWVYAGAMLIDAVIFNLVEFWTGENPIQVSSYEAPDGSQVVMTPTEDGRELRIEHLRDGEILETRRVIKTDEANFEINDEGGETIGRVRRLPSGDLELTRPKSAEKRILTRAAVEGFLASRSVESF